MHTLSRTLSWLAEGEPTYEYHNLAVLCGIYGTPLATNDPVLAMLCLKSAATVLI
jgi:hypothetical protein